MFNNPYPFIVDLKDFIYKLKYSSIEKVNDAFCANP